MWILNKHYVFFSCYKIFVSCTSTILKKLIKEISSITLVYFLKTFYLDRKLKKKFHTL